MQTSQAALVELWLRELLPKLLRVFDNGIENRITVEPLPSPSPKGRYCIYIYTYMHDKLAGFGHLKQQSCVTMTMAHLRKMGARLRLSLPFLGL